MRKKKSILEIAEARVGLIVQFLTPEQAQKARRVRPFFSLVESGCIALKATPFQDADQLALCVAMHTYMDMLLKIGGPHFEWDEASECAVVSELGKRLLLCSDLLNDYLCQRMPPRWSFEDVYLQSSYITLFRATLAVSIDKIRIKRKRPFVEYHQLTKDDVALLQRSLSVALRWIARPHSCALNRRLYVEMLKTKRSIENYLDALEGHIPQAVTLLVQMDVLEGDYGQKNVGDPAAELINRSPMDPYAAVFKTASAYIAMLQATWQGSLLGHLVKVTCSNQGAPQCAMVLFIRAERGASRWRVQLHALETDFNRQSNAKGRSTVFLNITDLTRATLGHAGIQAVRQLVEDLFIRELRYRRLNLPARHRSWSKGVLNR